MNTLVHILGGEEGEGEREGIEEGGWKGGEGGGKERGKEVKKERTPFWGGAVRQTLWGRVR